MRIPSIKDPRIMQLVSDLVALELGFIAYQAVRNAMFASVVPAFHLSDTLLVGTIVALGWLLAFWLGGLYRDYYVRSPFAEAFTVLRIVFIGSLIFFIAIYTDSPESYQRSPRYVFLLYWLLITLSVTTGRVIVRTIQRTLRMRGIIRIPTLLVGTASRVTDLNRDVNADRGLGYSVIGMISLDGHASPDVALLGTAADLERVLDVHRPVEMLITTDSTSHDELLKIAAQGTDAGCKVKIVPDMYEIVSGQARTHQVYGAPLIHVNPELMKPWEEFAKRLLDITVSILILIIGLPVWCVIALLVRLSSPGPVFFVQPRVGKNGKVFSMYKYRSMYVDLNRGETWTQKNDPRVTPIGRFIRKSHLDEIPQLWNVLRGDMSLVGFRPLTNQDKESLQSIGRNIPTRLYQSTKPGLSGLWQVTLRSEVIFEDRVHIELYYMRNWSIFLDIYIILRTVGTVLNGKGAY